MHYCIEDVGDHELRMSLHRRSNLRVILGWFVVS
jgi:hypothetical protein